MRTGGGSAETGKELGRLTSKAAMYHDQWAIPLAKADVTRGGSVSAGGHRRSRDILQSAKRIPYGHDSSGSVVTKPIMPPLHATRIIATLPRRSTDGVEGILTMLGDTGFSIQQLSISDPCPEFLTSPTILPAELFSFEATALRYYCKKALRKRLRRRVDEGRINA